MANEKEFLQQLKKEAKQQVVLESAHLFPHFQRFTAWTWNHAWQVWLLLSLVAAFIFEKQWGRCG
ncbi:MAG: hypothetical protein Q4G02_01655 [bacterium]|nr:hypothetical protein [bacterium]